MSLHKSTTIACFHPTNGKMCLIHVLEMPEEASSYLVHNIDKIMEKRESDDLSLLSVTANKWLRWASSKPKGHPVSAGS